MENTNSPVKLPFKIVPFSHDYAFKKLVAEDNLFSRKLIEITAELGAPVQLLELVRNEFEGLTMDSKAGIYDFQLALVFIKLFKSGKSTQEIAQETGQELKHVEQVVNQFIALQ